MVLITLQRLAEREDGSIPVLHDGVVNVLHRQAAVGLDVLGSNTETAVEIDSIGLQGGKDQVRGNRPVLVGLEDGEDDWEDLQNEVVKQKLVGLLQLNPERL